MRCPARFIAATGLAAASLVLFAAGLRADGPRPSLPAVLTSFLTEEAHAIPSRAGMCEPRNQADPAAGEAMVSFTLVAFTMFLLLRHGEKAVATIPDLLPFERRRTETPEVPSVTRLPRGPSVWRMQSPTCGVSLRGARHSMIS